MNSMKSGDGDSKEYELNKLMSSLSALDEELRTAAVEKPGGMETAEIQAMSESKRIRHEGGTQKFLEEALVSLISDFKASASRLMIMTLDV